MFQLIVKHILRSSGNTLLLVIVLPEDRNIRETIATITRCDLSSRFFCIDAALLCEFESNKI